MSRMFEEDVTVGDTMALPVFLAGPAVRNGRGYTNVSVMSPVPSGQGSLISWLSPSSTVDS